MLRCFISSAVHRAGGNSHFPYFKRRGGKLQKAVSIACEQKELIEINNSVESMVDKITGLEIVLKSKLDLIKPILDDCKDCRKDNCKDSCKDYGKDDCKNYGRDDKCDKKPHKSEY